MKTIETPVFEYAELNDKAKARALDWGRDVSTDGEWWESVYDDAERVGCKIEGFNTGRSNSIDFKLEWDAISVALAIRENWGEVPAFVGEFISQHDAFHGVNGFITLSEGDVEADHEERWDEIEDEFTRALGEEYLQTLKNEYDYLTGDEQVEEFIEANGYTFTTDGKRFG